MEIMEWSSGSEDDLFPSILQESGQKHDEIVATCHGVPSSQRKELFGAGSFAAT
jgi:hypothetical protein